MNQSDRVNILLVDDQPAKLLSYEVILKELGENLIKAQSAKEAFEHLLKTDIAIVLVDVCMPDLDGFQLAAMIREHPRFQKTAMIFVSAIHLTDTDYLRGYEVGAVTTSRCRWFRSCCAPRSGCSPISTARRASSRSSTRSSSAAWPSARRSCRRRRRASWRASNA